MTDKPEITPQSEEPADATRWSLVYWRVVIWLAVVCLLMWIFTQITQ